MTGSTEVQHGLKCGRCQESIYSNGRHDFVLCACGAWFIDGGFDYMRTGGLMYIPMESITRPLSEVEQGYYRTFHKRRPWSSSRITKWNKAHWGLVGEGVEERIRMHAKLVGKYPGMYADEIDL